MTIHGHIHDGISAIDAIIGKALKVNELARIARIETNLRNYIGKEWDLLAEKASKQAGAVMRSVSGDPSNDDIIRVMAKVDRVMSGWSDTIKTRYVEDNREAYELAHIAAMKRCLGKSKRLPDYNTPKSADTGVAKAKDVVFVSGDAGERVPVILPSFNAVDKKTIKAFEKHQVFWIGRHYKENVSNTVAEIARKTIVEAGLGREEAGKITQKVIREALDIVDVPAGFSGTSSSYFEGLVANAVTTQRVSAQLTSFVRFGYTEHVIVNPSDQRTCFMADCLVLLDDGSWKPIQEIKPGQYVITREGRSREVKAVIKKKATKWAKIRFEDGRTLVCTPDHELAEMGGGWIKAGNSCKAWVERIENASQYNLQALWFTRQRTKQLQVQAKRILQPSMLQSGPRGVGGLSTLWKAFSSATSLENKSNFLFFRVSTGKPKSKTDIGSLQGLRQQLYGINIGIQSATVLFDSLSQCKQAWRDLCSSVAKALSYLQTAIYDKTIRDRKKKTLQRNLSSSSCDENLSDLWEKIQSATWGSSEPCSLQHILLSKERSSYANRTESRSVFENNRLAFPARSQNWTLVSRLSDLWEIGVRSGRYLLAYIAGRGKEGCKKGSGNDFTRLFSGSPYGCSSEQRPTRDKAFVAWASQVIEVDVFDSTMDAYDLEVESDHSYVVGPGVVVHNCEICDLMNGKTFRTSDGQDVLNRLVEAKSPTAVKSIQPFMTVAIARELTGGKTGPIGSSRTQAISDRGNSTPPFHLRCRCSIDISEEQEIISF